MFQKLCRHLRSVTLPATNALRWKGYISTKTPLCIPIFGFTARRLNPTDIHCKISLYIDSPIKQSMLHTQHITKRKRMHDNINCKEVWDTYQKTIGKEGEFDSVSELCSVFWAWRMINWPEFATFCGYHEFDDHMNDLSLEGTKQREEQAQELLDHCDKIDMSLLRENEILNLHLLMEELSIFLKGAPYKGYLFPISFNEGLQCDFEQLVSWMKFETVKDYTRYLKRLKAIPKQLSDYIVLMKVGINEGKVHHHKAMEGVLEQFDKLLDKDIESTIFFTPLLNMPDEIDAKKREEIQDNATNVIKNEIQPSVLTIRDFIEQEYIPMCRIQEGVSSIPGGDEFYEMCLKFHISMDITPARVHEIGKNEVKRIRQEMMDVIEKIGFKGNFKDFLQHLRTSEHFYHQSEEELLEGFRDICYNKIRPKLPELFHKIPESELIIEPVSEAKKNSPGAYYTTGTLDGGRPGIFYVNTHDLKSISKYTMMTLALHEGEPGHHFQGMYAIEAKNLPHFRKYLEDMAYYRVPSRFPMHTAYVEGWALYCESLGHELGLYDDDPYALFGHLSEQMLRAVRLVVDTGIHAFGWSFEKASNEMKTNILLTDSEIYDEVRRYICWPGQACGYKIGELQFKELRQKAQDKLGPYCFDTGMFHDVVLRNSTVTLSTLNWIVDRYITSFPPNMLVNGDY